MAFIHTAPIRGSQDARIRPPIPAASTTHALTLWYAGHNRFHFLLSQAALPAPHPPAAVKTLVPLADREHAHPQEQATGVALARVQYPSAPGLRP